MADLGSILGSAGIGGQIGQAIVKLELDTAKYQAEMKAAQAQTVAGTNSMSSGFAKFGGIAKAGLGAAALGVVAFGANAVRAASDLGEAVNKSNVIFGQNAREIEEWAAGGAESFGLSKTAALDAASGFGAMLDSAGLAGDAAARMSMDIVELAGDMASFNNIDPTEALEKLRSGLAGEAEPLRRFGVFLSEAAVQQEAYQSGIAKTGEELTEAQKVQARYNIIFEQTTKAQGDFQRTADSLPNQLRTMRAEFENISAEVGTTLLPLMSDLLGVANELLDAFGPVLRAVFEGLSDVFGELSDDIKVLVANFQDLADIIPGVNAGGEDSISMWQRVSGVIDIFAKVGPPGIREVAAAVGDYSDAVEDASGKTDTFGEVLGGIGPNVREFIGETFKEITGAARGATDSIREFADMTGDELKDWRLKTKDSLETAILGFQDLTTESGITQDDLITGFAAMRTSALEFRRAMRELGQTSKEWIPEDFRVYLADLGPDALIEFANANAREQRRMVEDWKVSARIFKESIGGSFLELNGALDKLDKKETKHTILFRYKYEGFDPSKPGMTGGGGQSLIGGPQR